jgi:hypothetical protein
MPFRRRDTATAAPAAGDGELTGLLGGRGLDLAAAAALVDSRPLGSKARVSDHPWRYVADDPAAAYQETVQRLTG